MDTKTPLSAEKMRMVAKEIQEQLPNMGFALLVFGLNQDEHITQYISNAHREDMIIALEDVLSRWKLRKDLETPETN